jgi:hypothetical protein
MHGFYSQHLPLTRFYLWKFNYLSLNLNPSLSQFYYFNTFLLIFDYHHYHHTDYLLLL